MFFLLRLFSGSGADLASPWRPSSTGSRRSRRSVHNNSRDRPGARSTGRARNRPRPIARSLAQADHRPREERGRPMAAYDIKFTGGLIVDGSGRPGFVGDVAIKDGRVVALGQAPGDATDEIDAAGKVVAPGFVDVHTHYDA